MSQTVGKLTAYLPEPSPYLTLAGMAAYLGVSRQTVMKWVGRDILPPPLVLGPRTLRWPRDLVLEHLNRRIAAGTIVRSPTGGRRGRPRKVVPHD
jgi:excisionase family DNA binding protein